MTEQRFPVKDLPELYDASVIGQVNSLSKTPAYSRFTWTQNLHQLKKPVVSEDVKSIIGNFDEDRKRFDKMKQMRFVVSENPPEPESSVPRPKPAHNPPPRKRDPATNKTNESQSEEDDDVTRTRKGPKPALAARVASGLEKLDSLLSNRSVPPETVREQIEELAKHSRSKRQSLMRQLSEHCDRLFEDQTLISEKTEEMHRAFLKRITEVQSMLSPEPGRTQLTADDPQRRKQKQSSQTRPKKSDTKPNLAKERYLRIREKERNSAQHPKPMQASRSLVRVTSETSDVGFLRKL